jgi:hypothetical protein
MYFLHVVHKSFAPVLGWGDPVLAAELAPLTFPKIWRTTTLPMYSRQMSITVWGLSLRPAESSEK